MLRKTCAISLLMLVAAGSTSVLPGGAVATAQTAGARERTVGRGARIAVRNPRGRISITGWEQESVQVSATRTGTTEEAEVSMSEEAAHAGRLLIAPAVGKGGKDDDINLVIMVPREVEIESVQTSSAEVVVTGIVGPVTARSRGGQVQLYDIEGRATVTTESGNVTARQLGGLKVETQSGAVAVNGASGPVVVEATSNASLTAREIRGDLVAKVTSGGVNADDVGGLVDVTTTSGGVRVRNAGGDVHVVTLGGSVNVECAKERVDVSTVGGPVELLRVGGDTEVNTTGGPVSFAGPIRPAGRYRLRSQSAKVSMALEPDAPGFTATLSAYSAEIQTDFNLESELPVSKRRIIGRSGDGRARISLETFSGSVSLTRAERGASAACPSRGAEAKEAR